MKSRRFGTLLIFILPIIACNITAPDLSEPTATNAVPDPGSQVTATIPPTNIPAPEIPEEGLEDIYLQIPGAMSEVTSPLQISGLADATFEQNLVIKLTDTSGALISMVATNINADIGQGGPFKASVAFSVSAETQARLSIYHNSPRDGGLIHLTSIPIKLFPGGSNTINPSPLPIETISIETPIQNQTINGGSISFSGQSGYFFESNLSVTLCGEGGSGSVDQICGTSDNILLESFVTIASPDIGLPGPFSGSIIYSVTEPTHARLVIFARSPMDGGIEHLSSVDILLNP
ncbi:MAG: hypothetical protein HON98_10900 [Chloroflexi bacterium]|jgi:hypothetical protein|nr:hypothetical protein [Chloroflexota bacterium]MBT3668620.1 hypothetical protein [Chloroflexota bacterium]MBT4306235.1 hypothetical protein [Chloroflexota bacterium]MBT4532884.1 hypothetical protein [Chloroflexota bacterium]MBT4683431.1 hypothetical protein [Chloroflexota bacterium]